MSVLPGGINTTVNNGNLTPVSTTVNVIGTRNGIVGLLHAHSATAGLLDAKEHFDSPKCDEDMRTSMVLGMKRFVQDGNATSSPGLYWLHGPAGVGKSALAQALSLELKSEGDLAASFFFSRTSPRRNNGNQFIATLAYQLATSFPALQRFMWKAVKTNPAIFSASNAVQMQSLIIDPINKWQKRYDRSARRWVRKISNNNKKPHPRLILVDGLDKCNDRDVQRGLILCIASAVRQLSIPLRFIITSQPELHILSTFELELAFQDLGGVNVTKHELADDEDADAQITSFLVEKFAEIRRVHPFRDFLPRRWPHPDQIEQLISKSSKLFIYPVTVIRYLKMPNNRPDECLKRISGSSAILTYNKPYKPLDGLYHHIFESVPQSNKTSVRDIFHFLVLPGTWDGVISCTTIERYFDYMPGHVQHVLRDLLCLVAFTSDGYITVRHDSLPDFLLDQSRSGPLCIDVGDARTTIVASYLLNIRYCPELPGPDFVNLIKYMMQSNVSHTLLRRRILEVDLVSPYRNCCWMKIPYARSAYRDIDAQPQFHLPSAKSSTNFRYSLQAGAIGALTRSDIQSIAIMVAYLLVLVIKDFPQEYITSQIAEIKTYVLKVYPFAASGHAAYDKLVTIMIPLFRHWTSGIYHEYIDYIFAYEFPPSQYQISEAIFELHFLMMAPFCGVVVTRSSGGQTSGQINEKMKSSNWGNWGDIVRGRYRVNS